MSAAQTRGPRGTGRAAGASDARGWLEVAEAGSVLGLRFLLLVSNLVGRSAARLCLWPAVLYFMLFRGSSRRASREYLRRMGEPSGIAAVYRHLLRFGQCALDRLFFLQGKTELFRITRHGSEHLERLQREKRGAILLGAHLGSFEAMRARAGAASIPINIVGYFRNAEKINSVLARAGCNVQARFIEVEPGSVNFVLKLRELIERGELVAILGDRVVAGDTTSVDFLGGKAELPAGVFTLAALLHCPVYLTFALHHAPDRYDLYCELFADCLVLPRANRAAALQAHAQRFADRLEHYCRMAPDNWFNFYDFWSKRDAPTGELAQS